MLVISPPLVLALAARSEGKVYHFRIQRSSIGAYFVSDKISFGTLGELVSYYQRNPRSLGVLLEEPCAQQVGHKTQGFTSIPVRTLTDISMRSIAPGIKVT